MSDVRATKQLSLATVTGTLRKIAKKIGITNIKIYKMGCSFSGIDHNIPNHRRKLELNRTVNLFNEVHTLS